MGRALRHTVLALVLVAATLSGKSF